MADTITVDREAFYAALRANDVATVAAYFAQDRVRAAVAETEALVAARAPTELAFEREDGATFFPWYFHHRVPDGPFLPEFLLGSAARQDAVDVVAWFYADEQVSTMGRTLALAAKRVLLQCTSVQALDVILSSKVFRELVSGEDQRQLINALVWSMDPGFTALLVAHGAEVNGEGELDPLPSVARRGSAAYVDFFVENGAFIVGADVLADAAYLRNVASGHRLLHHGADWENADGSPLHVATEELRPDFVELLLHEGFSDVDAQDAEGLSALMKLAGRTRRATRASGAEPLSIARMLVEYSACVALKDRNGLTALDHAARSGSVDLARFLSDPGSFDRLHEGATTPTLPTPLRHLLEDRTRCFPRGTPQM